MKIPPAPIFKPAAAITDEVTSDKLNALAARSGFIVNSVGGNIRGTRGPNGWDLFGTESQRQSRGCLVYGGSGGALPGQYPLTAIQSDLDPTTSAQAQLVSVSGNVVTFLIPGLYQLTYSATVELDVGGSDTHNPGEVQADSVLRYGGTAFAASKGFAGAPVKANFSGFLKLDDEETSPLTQVAVGGATGKTAAFSEDGFIKCDPAPTVGTDNTIVFTCDQALTDDNLNVDNTMNVTLDTQTLDATDNFGSIADYTPTGTIKHTLSGNGFILVVRDPAASGALKINDGGTLRDPTVDIYGDGTPSGKCTALNATLLILKL